MGYIKKPKQKTNRELLAEENAEARKLGLDYSTYKEYLRTGYLDTYLRIKFHRDVERQADNIITERTWIGQSHGRANNKNAKWKKIN